MGFLNRLFKKEDKKQEVRKVPVEAKKVNVPYTGQKSWYVGDHIKRYGFYVNGVLLGTPSIHLNTKSGEYNRQMVLLKEAQEAIKMGDEAKLGELTKRARHEASLLKKDEFKTLVEEAYTKAQETGLTYESPEYRLAFSKVMEKAKDMQPEANQRFAEVAEKMHKDDVKEAPLAGKPTIQKAELLTEQIPSKGKDSRVG